MTAKSNQEIERHYFELFRKSYSLPDGKVSYGDKPDIIIEGKRRIGIEVRTFYLKEGGSQESLQKQRPIGKAFLKEAQQEYINNGGKSIIFFSFNKDHPIRDSKKLIPKVVEAIRNLETFETGGVRISNYFSHIPEIDFVTINPNSCNNPQWIYAQAHSGINQMSINKLEQILRNKEKKAEKYSKCDTFWLLMIIDSFDRAQEQLIPEEILDRKVKFASDIYEKIILFLPHEQLILHLKRENND